MNNITINKSKTFGFVDSQATEQVGNFSFLFTVSEKHNYRCSYGEYSLSLFCFFSSSLIHFFCLLQSVTFCQFLSVYSITEFCEAHLSAVVPYGNEWNVFYSTVVIVTTKKILEKVKCEQIYIFGWHVLQRVQTAYTICYQTTYLKDSLWVSNNTFALSVNFLLEFNFLAEE